MDLIDEYMAVHNGDRVKAAVNMALDLMRGDPETFKQGYTQPNAVYSVADMFKLSNDERGQVDARLTARHGEAPRYAAATFPDCLYVRPTGGVDRQSGTVVLLDGAEMHNTAILDYQGELLTGRIKLQGCERAILALAAGINAWCRDNEEFAREPHGSRYVTLPLFRAFYAALSYERGRLDGHTLWSWASDVLRSLGLDPDEAE